MDANHIPKALISYCWTSIEHREWVRELADRLRGSTFELFARAESLRHFEALKTLLRVESKEDLVEKMDAAVARPGFGAVGLRAVTLKVMMNLDQLGTRP